MKKQSEAGYSLVELSVVIIILGVMTAIAATLHVISLQEQEDEQFQMRSVAVDNAVLGFIFANGRLPCPASNAAGIENCALEDGFLPHRTLGLAKVSRDTAGVPLRFAIYDRIAVAGLGIDSNLEMGRYRDRFRPFMADQWSTGQPVTGRMQTLSNANDMDLCQAAQYGSTIGTDGVNLEAGTQPVAYLLYSSGSGDADASGSLLDGSNADGNLSFNSVKRIASAADDDRIKVMYFSQLWQLLGCNSIISPVGHGHPNAATTGAIMQRSLEDYLEQMEIVRDIADADIAAATAVIAAAAAGVAAAAAQPPIGTSQALVTAGAMVPAVVASAASVTLAAGGAVAAAATMVKAVLNKVEADALVVHVEDVLIPEINALSSSVRANALAADAKGIYTQ
ncbi:type II secretion system protein [Neptuniibacter sp.]|uniref:type II secretion system protein n=1 Tax=Neptuniibacter sp. TaxID=1962643 RepID=UPI0026238E12|nr:type II secretion system protein [Neptuniibacter sp.]MCP4595115.1 type II secretion system protein [Neptuniibacter sp.]